ncbi:MAG: hypothetical protein ACJA1B_000984 [Polaribacter sp.]|jgi:hypothetical protein
MRQQFSIITRFLLFSSGAALELIKKCPDFEINKYTSIGLTIFFTAVLSVLSSFFAFNLIFNSNLIAISLALFWGSIIFNLDRYIVSSMRISDHKFREFVKAIPRLLIAILIAVIISKPLEIKLFKSEISAFLNKEKTDQSDQNRQKYDADLKIIESKTADLEASFQKKLLLRDKYYEEYKCECTGTCGTKVKGYGEECRSRKERYDLFLLELNQEKNRKDSILKQYFLEKNKIQKTIDSEKAIILAHKHGLFDQIRALNQIDKISSVFIFFIFMMIEIAPVLTKLLSSKGPYDNLILEGEIQFEMSYLIKLDNFDHERVKSKKLKEISTNIELKSKEAEIKNMLKQDAIDRYNKMRQEVDRKNTKG